MTILIIGAGASGLMAAITAAQVTASNTPPCQILLFDGNEKAGKKIRATGNGKCNFFNERAANKSFYSSYENFSNAVYGLFDQSKTKEFFYKMGIPARVDSAGRAYPYSEQASTVACALAQQARSLGISFFSGDKVASVKRQDDGLFLVETSSNKSYLGNALILATGGKAGPQFGSDGDGYGFARSMGHSLIPPRPALVSVLCDLSEGSTDFQSLKGVRAKGTAVLIKNGIEVDREEGEIQFTDQGLSGVCIFNLSRYIDKRAPISRKKRKEREQKAQFTVVEDVYEISLDLVPDFELEEIVRYLQMLLKQDLNGTFEQDVDLISFLCGIVPDKLGNYILNTVKLFPKKEWAQRAGTLLKQLTFVIIGTKGWDFAQTTWGGVNCSEVDPITLESKLVSGLYFAGELLDVDGKCGGYNLQWAWSSGYAAGRAAGHKMNLLKKGE